jgi:hypothetical protein
VRVLLDESVPRQLSAHLPGHEAQTVSGLGWSGLQNGELLRRASGSFDVLVTGDQNLEFQQNLRGISIGIVVVAARDNRVETFVALADRIAEGITQVRTGLVLRVAG